MILDELNQRAEALQQFAAQFKQQGRKLKRKHRRANIKIITVVGVVIIGVILIIAIIASVWPEEEPEDALPKTP